MKKPGNLWNGFLLAVVLTVFLKTALTITGINLAGYFKRIPLVTNQMDLAEMIPSDKNTPWYYLAQPFYRFDAIWYEAVAKSNYAGLPAATAFFPLYPWTIKFLSDITHSPFYVTAFFLNTFLTFVMFFLLYMLIAIDEEKEVAQKAVILFAFFPTALFFLAPYAEPMLFCFFFASLIFMKKRYFLASFVFGFLAAMTKPYGFLIAIPLIVSAISEKEKKEKITRLILACLIPAGTLLVFYFQNKMIAQTPLAIMQGISGWHMEFVNPLKSLIGSLNIFIRNPFDLPNDLNLVTLTGAIVFLIFCRKKTGKGYWWFTLVLLLLFASYQVAGGRIPLKSFGRYFLAFFPIFIAMARTRMHNIIYIIYIAGGMFLVTVFFIYYVFGFFVF